MNLLKFLKVKKEDFLVLDFGKSSVKGLVFRKTQKENIIKKFWCEKIERFGVFNGRDFELEIVKKAADKVIENLGVKKEISRFPTLTGFSPDILKANVFEVSFKREKGADKIGKGEQDKIHEAVFLRARKKLFQKVQKKYKQEPGDLQILKENILESKISGYKVQSLLGFRGENFTFRVLIIFALRDSFKFALGITDSLKLKSPQIIHLVEGLINVQKLKHDSPRVFLDIGARTTQVFSFSSELRFVNEFEVGGYDFSKALWENLGLTEDETEVLKERFSKNQLSPKARRKLENVLSLTLELWLNSFQEKFKEEVGGFYFLPQRIFLLGGGSLLPGIKEALQKGNIDDVGSHQAMKVKFLDVQDFNLKNKTGVSLDARAIPAVLIALSEFSSAKHDENSVTGCKSS